MYSKYAISVPFLSEKKEEKKTEIAKKGYENISFLIIFVIVNCTS